jgi:hypothetical protein
MTAKLEYEGELMIGEVLTGISFGYLYSELPPSVGTIG